MNKAFFINGGAGRVLCSIPALEKYAETHDDFIIVAESWGELYLCCPNLREHVYPMGHKGLFEEKLLDKEIVSPEPYRVNQYFNQKCNLIQAFDIIINDLDEPRELPKIKLDISKEDQITGYNIITEVRQNLEKEKVVVFQPFGQGSKVSGNFIYDSSGRSFEVSNVIQIIERLKEKYGVILMSDIDIPGWTQMGVAKPKEIGLNGWAGVINGADYFLGCDSVGQHFAHAVNTPACVVIGSTFPENISYPQSSNFNIIDNGKGKRKYSPIRITFNIDCDRNNESLMVMEERQIDDIVKTIDKKLKPSKSFSGSKLNGIKPSSKGGSSSAPLVNFKPATPSSFKKEKTTKKKSIDEIMELEVSKTKEQTAEVEKVIS